MKIMSNQNITQRGTQTTGLVVMIGWCSPNSQHGKPDCHSANVGCSFFRYTNDHLSNHTNQRYKHKTWTREDNLLALQPYTKMIQEKDDRDPARIATFQITNQRLANKVRAIKKT